MLDLRVELVIRMNQLVVNFRIFIQTIPMNNGAIWKVLENLNLLLQK
jgi:hypothetical protein